MLFPPGTPAKVRRSDYRRRPAAIPLRETEKYAHVTRFFNGGGDQPFPGEAREIVPSAQVATYDLEPDMSAPEGAKHTVAALESGCRRADRTRPSRALPDPQK